MNTCHGTFTEVEWGVQFDRPGEALTVEPVHREAAAREMAEAYQAIGVKAEVVFREVTYASWACECEAP